MSNEASSKSLIVSILIPTYNEEKTIVELLSRVNRQKIDGVELEVIVIDDGSRDKTRELVTSHSHLYSRFIPMEKNGGKGAAVREGLKVATGDYVLFQDADLEYDPDDYGRLFQPILKFGADVVIGSRLLAPVYTRVVYFWHKMGNHFITWTFNLINNTTFSDIYSCYFLFKRKLVSPDELKTKGWEQQAEILTLAVRRGKVFYETPISYHGRTYDEGKKIRAHHVIAVLWTILLRGIMPLADVKQKECVDQVDELRLDLAPQSPGKQ